MSRKIPSYSDNRDDLHPDYYDEPESGTPLRMSSASQFCLPKSTLDRCPDARLGFTPIEFNGKIKRERFHEAVRYGYQPIDLNDFPELKRQVYFDDVFGDKPSEEGERLTYHYGGQVCMKIALSDYDKQQAEFDVLKRKMEDMVAEQRQTPLTPVQVGSFRNTTYY